MAPLSPAYPAILAGAPEYFEEWISKLLEDPLNRKAMMEQIDGKPKQSIDHTTAGKAIAGFNFTSNAPTIRPTPKQELAWEKLQDSIMRFLLFGGGAGGGKTWLYCRGYGDSALNICPARRGN
jgi:hypothetical protein